MKHRVKGKKLKRSLGHRRALYKNLAVSLIEHGQIKTTLGKAKAVRPFMERLITHAKKGDLAARRRLLQKLSSNRAAVKKLVEEIAPQFARRNGGYTRIIKLGSRVGDQAEMARLEFVGIDVKPVSAATKKKDKKLKARKLPTRKAEENTPDKNKKEPKEKLK